MKTIDLTALQALRLTLMIDNHQGQRRELRMLGELRRRIGFSDEEIAKLVTPIAGGGGASVIAATITNMPDRSLELVPEEARRVLDILNTQTLTVRDLTWTEPLVKALEAACE
jgi:hypothetical protein